MRPLVPIAESTAKTLEYKYPMAQYNRRFLSFGDEDEEEVEEDKAKDKIHDAHQTEMYPAQ